MSACAACEERLPDLADGTLGVVVQNDVLRHLAQCAPCRELQAALALVQRSGRVEPAADDLYLAYRIARHTWRRPRRLAAWWPLNPDRGGPPWRVQALAAGLSVVFASFIYVGSLVFYDARSRPARAYRALNQGAADFRSRTDGWMEDLRLVRVLVSTALGGRLDSVQDQVEDYRRLMDKPRPSSSPVPNDRTPSPPSS